MVCHQSRTKFHSLSQRLYLLKINTMLRAFIIILMLFNNILLMAQTDTVKQKPLRVAVVGLVHDHVGWILGYKNKNDIEVVGIAEPNHSLAEKYSRRSS